MDRFKDIDKIELLKGIALLMLTLVIVIAASIGNVWLLAIGIVLFVVLFLYLSPIKVKRPRIKGASRRVRYRILHSDLEVLTYSSTFRYFDEGVHPMDELMNIDYKASYKRHYIKASIDEETFIYHEETLFPTKKIPVVNVFQGFVVEFNLKEKLPKKFTMDHPLFKEQFPKNYIYTNGNNLRVYIPNARPIEDMDIEDDVEKIINELTNNIRKIIESKKEFLLLYKEEQK